MFWSFCAGVVTLRTGVDVENFEKSVDTQRKQRSPVYTHVIYTPAFDNQRSHCINTPTPPTSLRAGFANRAVFPGPGRSIGQQVPGQREKVRLFNSH